MDAAPATAVTDVVEMLAGPAIMHMVHSHAGADVACRALALGTAKQRKKAIKAMKGAAATLGPHRTHAASCRRCMLVHLCLKEGSNTGMCHFSVSVSYLAKSTIFVRYLDGGQMAAW